MVWWCGLLSTSDFQSEFWLEDWIRFNILRPEKGWDHVTEGCPRRPDWMKVISPQGTSCNVPIIPGNSKWRCSNTWYVKVFCNEPSFTCKEIENNGICSSASFQAPVHPYDSVLLLPLRETSSTTHLKLFNNKNVMKHDVSSITYSSDFSFLKIFYCFFNL